MDSRRAALTLLFVCASFAAVPSDEQKGKKVIDEALQALGGEKFLAMSDRIESGRAYSFYRDQLSGLSRATVYTRYLIRPEPPIAGFVGVRERQAFGKDEDSAVVFADDKGYQITFRGAKPMPDEMLERFKDSTLRNVFYILRQRLGEPGLIFESRGADIMDNQPVEIVDIIDGDNRTVKVYFNQSTKLPVRQVYYRRHPQTRDRIEEVTLFSKYRDVGNGVQWPFAIRRERDGEKIFEIFSDKVTINNSLPDNTFTLPANMKILSKK
jgi:hypothetical protein